MYVRRYFILMKSLKIWRERERERERDLCDLAVVGTRFSAQAQNVWDAGPVNPVQ